MNRNIAKTATLLVLAAITLSFAQKKGEPGKQQKLLMIVGYSLQKYHYLSPVINDDFSKALWKDYVDALDGKKNILLKADVNALSKYQTYLDNEMRGDSLLFFPEITNIYAKRRAEVATLYKELLSKPFVFEKNGIIELDRTPKDFPKNETERRERWKNSLKFITLQKLTELQDTRLNSKSGDATYHKTDLQLEQEARQFVLKQYDRIYNRYNAYSEDKLFGNYLNVITRYLDPHTDYMAPVDKKSFDERMGNRFYGIGIQLNETEGQIKMAALTPGSPAFKSGAFAVNDVLTKIGQGPTGPMTEVAGMEIEDVVKLIRGDKGTIVRIGYKKTDGTNAITPLVRAEIKQEEALARSAVILEKGKKIGYLNLPLFYDDFGNPNGSHCADDVAREIVKLKADQVDGIVMDLRFNGGGSLNEVIKMVGLFVGSGPVVQTRNSKGEAQVYASKNELPLYTGPLTVMVNEYSASASEIFAGAIQDYKRGLIVGTTTFGKGTVQNTSGLGPQENGALKLTISKFYRVNGASTQQKGIVPDVILPNGGETRKNHEGDQPHAMPWDQVAVAKYKSWSVNIDSIAALATQRLAAEPAFSEIRNNNVWLEKHPDTLKTMTVAQYKADLEYRRKIAKQNGLVQKLKDENILKVNPAAVIPEEKQASYLDWYKKIAADLYIRQAVFVTLDQQDNK
ncbi:carboxy terminal-processing peptidase [Pedobacter sp. MC2016-14]|uniref:carboxy terminal-processing peptidase n=1 Tax=Pedobacter sp. MC2016-14 TaxID=2897327 RepID=UPI001E504904|nr:carboxy terminal-processing peptidase [Pedobacter sp. MC2016-14]MCD0490430.1 carboxy terminal-processing peptidase [Pedobacter sp. MC2016-14]